MINWWIGSYIVLWLVVLCLCGLQLGELREIGTLRRSGSLAQVPPRTFPDLANDGPSQGSRIPDVVYESVNGHGSLAPASLADHGPVLVVFLSPVCEGCQDVVSSLNAVIAKATQHDLKSIAILSGPEVASRSFLRIFPLDMPVAFDATHSIAEEFNVHHNPFALLYSTGGRLMAKSHIAGAQQLHDLLAPIASPSVA